MASSGYAAVDTLRVVILGKTGAGKSTLGNTLTGLKAPKVEPWEKRYETRPVKTDPTQGFKVSRHLSQTMFCDWREANRMGTVLQVTDTPGLYHTHLPDEHIYKELKKSVAVAQPGPHVIIFVLRCDRRFTQIEKRAYDEIKKLFSEEMNKYLILVFNGMDTFRDDAESIEEQRQLLADEVGQHGGAALQSVIQEADGRIFGMNIQVSPSDKDRQAQDLINMMKDLVRRNKHTYYKTGMTDRITKKVEELTDMKAAAKQVDQVMAEKTIRMVLLGKTGVGKSSTANTLLGRDCFHVSSGMSSCTQKCHWEEVKIESEHVVLQVTDTIGVSDTHREKAEVPREVGKSIAVTSPGPHVILMLIRCDTRFTEDEFLAYVTLKEMFGPKVTDYMIVVFVGMDSYGSTLEEQTKGLKQGIQSSPRNLKVVMEEVQWRFFGINNKASPSDKQRQAVQLIRMMKTMKHQHGGGYFMNSVSDHVNDLVRPLVSKRVTQGHMTQSEAVRETNKAIMEETESSDFFRKLCEFVNSKLIPALKLALEVAQIAVPIALEVAKVSGKCTVM